MSRDIYLSVITPCYNGERFIESAIGSVLNQPVDGIEMIVVNDGSSDATAEICSRYKHRIRYIETENRGAGHARNVAMAQAKGTWIAFLDSDDLYFPDSFTEKTFDFLRDMEQDGVDVIYTPWIMSDMGLQQIVRVFPSEEASEIRHIPQHEFWTCLYRRAFLEEKQVRFYEYKEQDIATAFRYLVFSQSPKVVTRNDFRFIIQRDNLESNTHTWKFQTLYYVKATVYYDLLKNHGVEASMAWLYREVTWCIYHYFRSVVKEGCRSSEQKKKVRQLLKCALFDKKNFSIPNKSKIHLMVSVLLSCLADLRGMQKRKECNTVMKKPVEQEDTDRILNKLNHLGRFLRG